MKERFNNYFNKFIYGVVLIILLLAGCYRADPKNYKKMEEMQETLKVFERYGFDCSNNNDYVALQNIQKNQDDFYILEQMLDKQMVGQPNNINLINFKNVLSDGGCPKLVEQDRPPKTSGPAVYSGDFKMSDSLIVNKDSNTLYRSVTIDGAPYPDNRVDFEIEPNSLVIVKENTVERVSFNVYVRHNLSSPDNSAQTIILSDLFLSDDKNNKIEIKAQDLPINWQTGVISNSISRFYIFNKLPKYSVFQIPLVFDITRYEKTNSRYYDFSLTLKGKKILIRINTLNTN